MPHTSWRIGRAMKQVERWSYNWGFNMSESKSCYMVLRNKFKTDGQQLTLYDRPMTKVSEFRYLGLWFDSEYTWKMHINQVETKC